MEPYIIPTWKYKRSTSSTWCMCVCVCARARARACVCAHECTLGRKEVHKSFLWSNTVQLPLLGFSPFVLIGLCRRFLPLFPLVLRTVEEFLCVCVCVRVTRVRSDERKDRGERTPCSARDAD